MSDWFAQNAPDATQAAQASGPQDWFTQHAPGAQPFQAALTPNTATPVPQGSIFDRMPILGKALDVASDINNALNVPVQAVTQTLENTGRNAVGPLNISSQPGVKTVAGLVGGLADPRQLPFAGVGTVESPIVRGAADTLFTGLAGTQAYNAAKQGNYGQAALQGGLGLLAGAGAIGAGRDIFADRDIPVAQEAASTQPAPAETPSTTRPIVRAVKQGNEIKIEQPVSTPTSTPVATGSPTVLKTTSGDIPATFKVVEASDIRASHNPQTFAPNPDYPAGIQERTYHTDKAAQARVVTNAQNYDPSFTVNSNPDAVNGPPIIGPDGIAYGGNGRSMTLQRLYADGNAADYKSTLEKNAAQFGIDPQQVISMKQPVLVRELQGVPTDQAGQRKLVSDLNRNFTGGLTPTQKAVSAGLGLSQDTVEKISNLLDQQGDDATLRSLIDSKGKQVLGLLTDDGVIPQTERPQYVDPRTGEVNGRGKDFIEQAILGKVIGDADTLDTAPKSALNKVSKSLPALAKLGARNDGWNVLPALRQALRDSAVVRSSGQDVGDYLSNKDFFKEPNPLVDAFTQALMGDMRPKEFAAKMRDIASAASSDVAGQGSLGLTRTPEPFEAIDDALGTKLSAGEYNHALGRTMAEESGAKAAHEPVPNVPAGMLPVDVAGNPIPIGPGHKTIGNTGEGTTGHPLLDVADAVAGNADENPPEGEAAPTPTPAKPGIVDRAKTSFQDFLKETPAAYRRAKEGFSGYEQLHQQASDKFIRAVSKAIPSLDRQNAVIAWAEAGGDNSVLADQAAQLKAAGKKAAKYYEIAQNLSDSERAVGNNIRNYLDSMHTEANEAGVIKGFRENYIPRVTDTADSSGATQGQALARFNRNTRYGRERQFPTRFDAEMAGYKPRWDGMRAISDYSDSVDRAIATRKFQETLLHTPADDGRTFLSPSGAGRNVPETEGQDGRYIVLPFAKPNSVRDYQPINNSAFRLFRYATQDDDGKPILTESPLVAHPSIAGDLKRILEPSAFQGDTKAAAIGRGLLKLNTGAKKLLFGFSPMHMVSEGSRAQAFGANPVNLPDLDFNANSTLTDGLHHGLTLFRSSAPEAEGLTGGGIYDRIPGVGRAAHAIENEVWDYANRAKAAAYNKAYTRNLSRYSDSMTRDDIASLSARQVNNAFGGLNHFVMGRGKTFQDVLRLALIAPDFEEGNLRFALSNLTPKGAEARRAFVLQAGKMYLAARVANAALNKGNTYPDKPFSVIYNKRQYDIRSMPTDLLGLIKNPRTTLAYRQSPVATLGTELATGRDQFGRLISAPKAVLHSVERALPIAAQGPLGLGSEPNESIGRQLLESAGTSAGIHDYPYRSPAEAKAQEYARAQVPDSAQSTPHSRLFGETVNKLRLGTIKLNDVQQLVKAGKLSPYDAGRAIRESQVSALVKDSTGLQLPQALEVYRLANAQERQQLKPLLAKKLSNSLASTMPTDRQSLIQSYNDALASTPYGIVKQAAQGFRPFSQ